MLFYNTSLQKTSTTDSLLQGKTVLLVHIGSQKKMFIPKRMRELGLRVVALHTEKPLWAIDHIDDWILVDEHASTTDIMHQIQTYQDTHSHTPIEGAVTFWEEEVPLLASICETFGFIGNAPTTSHATRSKFHMQELLKQKQCNAMRQALITNTDELQTALSTVGFPAIMKPLYGADSLFVVYIKEEKDAEPTYDYLCKNYQKHPYELLSKYECGLFVYQEYIDGKEFSLECYVQNGVPHVIGIQEKTNMELPFFMETGDIIPPQISQSDRNALETEAKKALIALGVTNSVAHVEIKLSSKGPQVIEIASRMGGDYTYHVVKEVYDFDMVKAACEIALGIPVREQNLEPQCCVIGRYFIPTESGVVTALHNFQAFDDRDDVCVFPHVSVGDAVHVPPFGFDSAGWVCVRGKTYAEAINLLEVVCAVVRVDIQPFRSPSSVARRTDVSQLSHAL